MTSPAVKTVLKRLLSDPENGYCADCKTASHPRWASWSMGVFVCIRCAGIHRSLGTHISKVKSVDLDTWKEEHLRKVVEYGNNKRANAAYECKLKGNHTPDASQLGSFIRSKYERKKWFDECGDASAELLTDSQTSISVTVSTSQPVSRSSSAASSTASSAPGSVPGSLRASATPSQVNLNLTPVTGAGATAATPLDGRPDLKRSILSLYSRPRNSASGSLASTPGTTPGSTPNAIAAYGSAYTPPLAAPAPAPAPAASLEDNELFKNVWS